MSDPINDTIATSDAVPALLAGDIGLAIDGVDTRAHGASFEIERQAHGKAVWVGLEVLSKAIEDCRKAVGTVYDGST